MFALKIFFGGGPPIRFVVCASKPRPVSSACKNFRGQHPQGPKFSVSNKVHLVGSICASITVFLVETTFTKFLSSNRGWNVVDQVLFRFSICRSVPEIFAIKVESCQNSHRILGILCFPKFSRGALAKLVFTLSPRPPATSRGKVS